MVNFYGKFIPNMSSELHPLYILLRKEKWKWEKEQEEAFQKAKEAIVSAKVLVHYHPKKKLKLTVYASPYGV
jgi:hypothetical protein